MDESDEMHLEADRVKNFDRMVGREYLESLY